MIVRGNTVGTTVPQPDYAQTDESHASFIRNKPDAVIAKAQQTADSAKTLAEAALPKTGGAMAGPIDMQGHSLTNLPQPQAPTDPATRQYVDSRWFHAAVTLKAGGWSEGLQTVTVSGITADPDQMDILASPDPQDGNYTAYTECCVRLASQGEGSLTFRCAEEPEVDLTVQLLVFLGPGTAAPVQQTHLLKLDDQEAGYTVQAVVEGETYGVENLSVNQGPTETRYDFTVL